MKQRNEIIFHKKTMEVLSCTSIKKTLQIIYHLIDHCHIHYFFYPRNLEMAVESQAFLVEEGHDAINNESKHSVPSKTDANSTGYRKVLTAAVTVCALVLLSQHQQGSQPSKGRELGSYSESFSSLTGSFRI
jgi:hypothetical protein